MSVDITTECSIEIPPRFCDQLGATMNVSLSELPSYLPTNIINHNQSYQLKVCLELSAAFKKIFCGKWCINVAVERCGPGPDFMRTKTIDMDNCNPQEDCVTFTINGRDFETANSNHCGEVFHFCITAVALDPCEGAPIGIAGFCKLGPVMVY